MEGLKHCEVFKDFNDQYDKSEIHYACVPLKNEAFVVEKNGDVRHFVNNGSSRIDKLCGKGVIEFAYAHSNVNGIFGYHILARTEDGRVYGWGRNNFKQVSALNKDDITVPERLKITKGPIPVRIVKSTIAQINENYNCCSCCPNCINCKSDAYETFEQIACSLGHCMAVTKAGDIIIWGNNKFGQIGNSNSGTIVDVHKIFIKNDSYEPSCSIFNFFKASQMFFSTYLGKVFPFSMCINMKMPEFVYIKETSKVKTIVCGSFHSLVLLENGLVYGWGDNRYGQLGKISTKPVLVPVEIQGDIAVIASCNLYTLTLSKQGVLYAMGDNTFAQLGNNENGVYYVPTKLADLKFTNITTINQLSLGITNDQRCFIWGLYKLVKKNKIEHDPNCISDVKQIPQTNKRNKCVGKTIAGTMGSALMFGGAVQVINNLNDSEPNEKVQPDQNEDEGNEKGKNLTDEGDKQNENEVDKVNNYDYDPEENNEIDEEEDIVNDPEENNEIDKEEDIENDPEENNEIDEKEDIVNDPEENNKIDEEEDIVDDPEENNEDDFDEDNQEGKNNAENKKEGNSGNRGITDGLAMSAVGVGMLAMASTSNSNETDNQADNRAETQNNEDELGINEDNQEKLTYIIVKPTEVKCKSFEKIIAKCFSITSHTIINEMKFIEVSVEDDEDIIDLDSLLVVDNKKNLEERRNVKILKELMTSYGKKKVQVYFGTQNKFSVISDSYVMPNGNIDIKDISQVGTENFSMKNGTNSQKLVKKKNPIPTK